MPNSVQTRLFPIVSAIILGFTLAGCPTQQNSTGSDTTGGGTFSSAADLSFSADGKAQLSSSRINGGQADFYKLGSLAPGDHVVIDVQAASGDLDPVAAVFDADENIMFFNDDRTEDGSNLNPLIDQVIFGESSEFVVGVTAFPGSGTSGTYKIDVSITKGGPAPQPQAQTVFLNWAGGHGVTIANVGTFNLPAFSATEVGLAASSTDALKQRVQAIVADRYKRFDMILLNSDANAVPTAAHSTVQFGGFNRQAFAISEQVDSGNPDKNDSSIIFTESFNGAFSVNPTLEQMATAMGNTVAHEVGHLLGLVHTKDAKDEMDTTGGNESILVAQAFTRAPIDDSVFPTGFQDESELIGWLIGLSQM